MSQSLALVALALALVVSGVPLGAFINVAVTQSDLGVLVHRLVVRGVQVIDQLYMSHGKSSQMHLDWEPSSPNEMPKPKVSPDHLGGYVSRYLTASRPAIQTNLKPAREVVPISKHFAKGSNFRAGYISGQGLGIANIAIEDVIDNEAPAILSHVRSKLELPADALIMPSNMYYDYLVDQKQLHQEKFVGACGGNMLDPVGAWFDIIDFIPHDDKVARIWCKTQQVTLEETLQWCLPLPNLLMLIVNTLTAMNEMT
eukprot:scaffold71659_cov57-Attheya_sp.AAC.7